MNEYSTNETPTFYRLCIFSCHWGEIASTEDCLSRFATWWRPIQIDEWVLVRPLFPVQK